MFDDFPPADPICRVIDAFGSESKVGSSGAESKDMNFPNYKIRWERPDFSPKFTALIRPHGTRLAAVLVRSRTISHFFLSSPDGSGCPSTSPSDAGANGHIAWANRPGRRKTRRQFTRRAPVEW
jgi:hypothetical protein